MSRIRPIEPDDLPAVADLYELVIRSGRPQAAPELVRYLRRLTFDQPGADPELPSLVYDDPDEGIVGFIAAYPRHLVDGDQPLRMVCSGQLVAHPDARSRGVGALLMRKLLAGPQDVTVTDGATGEVRTMWERLGGMTNTAASIGWAHVVTPARYRADAVARRLHRSRAPAPGMWRAVDGVVRRVRSRDVADDGDAAPGSTRPLTVAAVLDELPRLARAFPLRPAYDAELLTWLFHEMDQVRSRGPLVRRAVHDASGRCIGWYVAYLPSGDVAQVVQVAGDDVAPVLDELLRDAADAGATAVEGRVDPYLYPALRARGCRFRPTTWSLVHARDPAVVASIMGGRALLTRLDGEWWMGHHRV